MAEKQQQQQFITDSDTTKYEQRWLTREDLILPFIKAVEIVVQIGTKSRSQWEEGPCAEC